MSAVGFVPPRVEMRGIDKVFPGLKALDGVDFTLLPGEIHALMGENGAGKSTLLKVLTGVHPSDGGTVHLDGQLIKPRVPLEAQALGIQTVYQEVNLVPDLSVAENLYLGRQPMKAGCIDWPTLNRLATKALDRLGLDIDPTRSVKSYSIAIQQLVAIARALDQSAKVLVLDEPTSSLDAGEVKRLFDLLRRLRSEGLGIVFVTHFLDQVFDVCDRITVLRNGKLVGSYPISDMTKISLVARMLGKDEQEIAAMASAPKSAPKSTEVALDAQGISRKGSVEATDLKVSKGEVLGFAGLLGSGRTETARLLFGLDKFDHGSITFNGIHLKKMTPRRSLKLGIAMVPEDRKIEGAALHLSVRENIILSLQARRGWLRPLSKGRQKQIAERLISALHIATASQETLVGQLSGGNQQKVVLAKWLAAEPQLLILDEPTRGVDVGAKAEIEDFISRLCDDGMAIVLIASEIEDVARQSHRLIVMRDRKKVGELVGDEIEVPKVMSLIAEGQA